MKYIKPYEIFESSRPLLSASIAERLINYVDDVLIDLVDDGWCIRTEYVPKRWENSPLYTIKSDCLDIRIQKVQTISGSRYRKENEFNLSDVSEVNRLLTIFRDNEIKTRICKDAGEPENNGLIYGEISDYPTDKINDIDYPILFIELFIYIDGDNLDQIKESVDEKSDKEITEDAKQELDDVLLYLRDDGHPISVKVVMDYHGIIYISVLDYQHEQANWGDIKDDIIRAISVVSDRFVPTTVYYKQVQPDGRIFRRDDRDQMSWREFLNYTLDDSKLAFFSIELTQIIEDNKNWNEDI